MDVLDEQELKRCAKKLPYCFESPFLVSCSMQANARIVQ